MPGLLVGDSRGGHRCSFDDVCNVSIPKSTETYTPVPNGDLVRMVFGSIKGFYDLSDDDLKLSLALSSKDQQMFGAVTINPISSEAFKSALTVCFRNSYNKSLSVALAAGANSWICSNLQISGDIIELRKHTSNILNDIEGLIGTVVGNASESFFKSMHAADQLKKIPVSMDDAYRMVGLALGYDVLKPQQATIVMRELSEPSYEEFSEKNAWSLYNHFTESLKKSPAGEVMRRHKKSDDFFKTRYRVGLYI